MKKRCVVLVALSLVLAACVCWKGGVRAYELTCKTEECGFKANFRLDRKTSPDRVCGYCPKCKDMVEILHPGETGSSNETSLKEVSSFWDPATGTRRFLYKCPNACGGVFVGIQDITQFVCCPKCGKENLTLDEKGKKK